MRNNTKLEKRNKNIVEDFERMANVKTNGKRKYTYDHIFEKLGDKYFIAAATVEKIIAGSNKPTSVNK
ncbi:MAG: hypothetical protein AB7G44_03465 [Bacteroidia bacterium]